jgi:hypothetical protein
MQVRSEIKRRGGKVVVLIALSLTLIIGALAFTIDGGLMLDYKRKVQAAADAAALAAATDLYDNYSTYAGVDTGGSGLTSARDTASANGFNNDGVTNSVTVTFSPNNYQGGSSAGTAIPAGYVEVIITYYQSRGFSGIFGSSSIPVKCRAVARGCYTTGTVGILMMNKTISNSLEIDGNLNILNGGQIYVDSTSATATQMASTATLSCGGLNVAGSGIQQDSGSSISYTNSGHLTTGISYVSDPLAYLPDPTKPSTSYNTSSVSGTVTLQPGYYKNKLNIGSNAVVTMAPGMYWLDGGIVLGSNCSLTGTGVMIYNNAGDNLNFKSAATVNLTPPTSGTYKGISVWQPRTDTQEVHIECSNSITISGTWYAQTGEFDFRPDGADTVYNMGNYICDQMEAGQGYNAKSNKSNGQINLDPTQGAPTVICIQLVE